MKLLNDPLTYFAAYVAMIIFTFGHAYNNVPKEEVAKFAGQEFIIQNGGGFKTMVGLAAGAAWPLYWSVKLQEK